MAACTKHPGTYHQRDLSCTRCRAVWGDDDIAPTTATPESFKAAQELVDSNQVQEPPHAQPTSTTISIKNTSAKLANTYRDKGIIETQKPMIAPVPSADPNVLPIVPGVPRLARMCWKAKESTSPLYIADKEQLLSMRFRYTGPTVTIPSTESEKEHEIIEGEVVKVKRYLDKAAPFEIFSERDQDTLWHTDPSTFRILQQVDCHRLINRIFWLGLHRRTKRSTGKTRSTAPHRQSSTRHGVRRQIAITAVFANRAFHQCTDPSDTAPRATYTSLIWHIARGRLLFKPRLRAIH